MTAKEYQYVSDRRVKENIENISNPLEKLNALRGVSYQWRSDSKKDFGFIAQEVRDEIPEIVKEDNYKGFLSIDYVKITPILVEAIKRQQNRINILKLKLKSLK